MLLLPPHASERTSGNLDCHICDKQNVSRQDKHMCNLHERGPEEVKQNVGRAKKALIIRKLSKLRRTRPIPPTMSTLNLDSMPGDEGADISNYDIEDYQDSPPAPPSLW
ncbi:hypothetical protein AAFF_G00122440 [Aldrovandia affinis]|uniref:Uncharacterized protein n=1 Tax=Aldrovandia affinis TaxID=143900 RepID=A0AAD7RRT8_9TELE|nr:hypothetical protein AAFF_G00122440 [Aldrovandia affinis]